MMKVKQSSATKRFKVFVINTLVATGLAITSVANANNPPPKIKADAPNRYVVKKGDTLWDISGKFLKSPWRWKEIWAVNKQIRNPHLIYPGDILILCVIKGKTLVGIDTGEGCAGIEKAMNANQTADTSNNVTITSVAGSVPAIPLSSIEAWLDRSIVVSPNDFKATPYVIASKNKNLLTGAGDKIYAKGVPLIIGQRYGVYREGKPYVDPMTLQVLGLEVTQVASGVVTDVANNGISSIELDQNFTKEVQEGDKVFIEMGNELPPVFYPQPAKVNRGGRVVRVMDSINRAAKGSVIAVNLGTFQGAKAGDVLAVFRKGALIRDDLGDGGKVRLPSEQAGLIMIFKTFDNISYAYVLESEVPIDVNDLLMPVSE